MSFSLLEISEITKGELIGSPDTTISNLCIDSRIPVASSETLFIAIKGERNDGHQYIEQLHKRSIKNFLVEKLPQKEFSDSNFIIVENSLVALQQIATANRRKYDYPVIGITGSNGKTIIKEWLHHCLKDKFNIVRSPKSYNSQVGVPLSIWLMGEEHSLAIFEAGISLPEEMGNLEVIVKPNIGIISNIGSAHQKNFESLGEKLDEKLKLFKDSETIIYCKDHELIDKKVRSKFKDKKLVSWGKDKKNTYTIRGTRPHPFDDKGTAILFENNKNGNFYQLKIPYNDSASIENAIHTIILSLHLDLDVFELQQNLNSLPSVAMRLELKKGINNCTIINDSYNSDINSLQIALNHLKQQNQHKSKTLILSDILQSSKNEEALYTDVAKLVKTFEIDRFIGVGKSLKNYSYKFPKGSSFYESTNELIQNLGTIGFIDEAILLKAAREFQFERISRILEERTHRTILEINLNALIQNLNTFRSKLKPKTKIMAMVKALSYGSGTYEIANILEYNKIDYLGVAYIDEGIALREAGIKTPIVVMNPGTGSIEAMIDHNLEPNIYNFKMLESFTSVVKEKIVKGYPIHIKLETGMYRLGFNKKEIPELIKKLKQTKEIVVSSIFSHLAASDEATHDTFTHAQIALFNNLSQELMQNACPGAMRHILNSAGVERFPESQFEMIRLGIGLYGISASNASLAQVSTMKTIVSQIKKIKKGETVGYGRKGVSNEDKTIAIIPVGYADGINRKLSNGVGEFSINGFKVPIIGNVCMDMCMVDITGKEIYEGDEVIIFGNKIPVQELADKLGTIPYEIFTSIPERVKRVYYQE